MTPLHLTCQNGFHECTKFFIRETNMDINAKTSSGETALHIAVSCNCLEDVKTIAGCSRADLNATNMVIDFHCIHVQSIELICSSILLVNIEF